MSDDERAALLADEPDAEPHPGESPLKRRPAAELLAEHPIGRNPYTP